MMADGIEKYQQILSFVEALQWTKNDSGIIFHYP